MHFLFITSGLLLSSAISVRGSPLPVSTLETRSVKFHILTGAAPPNPLTGTPDDEVCDPTQVETIKNGITQAKEAASKAIKVLKSKDVTKSNGFFWLLGGGSGFSASAASQPFEAVEKLGTPNLITSTKDFEGSTTDLIFTCIPAAAAKTDEAYASTINVGDVKKGSNGVASKLNLIRFTIHGLQNTGSFDAAATAVKNSGNIQSAFAGTPQLPTPVMAFTLVHEVQHSKPLVGASGHMADQVEGLTGTVRNADDELVGKRSYGFKSVQHRISAQKQRSNPQNYAFLALVAASNPEFFSASTCPSRQDQPLLGATVDRRALLDGFEERGIFVSRAKTTAKKAPVAKPGAPKPAAPKPAPVKAKPAKAPVAKPVAPKPAAPKPAPAKAKPAKAPVAAKPAPPPPAKAPAAPAKAPAAPAKAPAKAAKAAKAPAAPAKAPAPPVKAPAKAPAQLAKPPASPAKASAAPKASAASAPSCKVGDKVCATCSQIAEQGLPGDVNFPENFDDE